ncbi:MAG: hypothetical protein JRJ84_19855 [Deltaproteobacteria bacterium]|nr:hypothetical protein [Deltaproteobacteria bacterium]
MRALAIALLLTLFGCGSGEVCEDDAQVLMGGTEGLTCGDVASAQRYVEILAGRGTRDPDLQQLRRGLVKRFRRDAEATRSQLAAVSGDLERWAGLTGLEAAEARSAAVHDAVRGRGAFGPDDDKVKGVVDRTVAVWAWSDEERLALTEVDIEGWIFYGSLCREAQEASPFRVSVSDRVAIYRMLTDRYDAGSREEKVALSAIGPFWPKVRELWSAAPYERQQAWITAAPLPPPMVATSKGYLSTLLDGNVVAHARVLHESLGPFQLGVLP